MITALLYVLAIASACVTAHGACAYATPFQIPAVLATIGAAGLLCAIASRWRQADGSNRWQQVCRGAHFFVLATAIATITIYSCEQLTMRQIPVPIIGWAISLIASPFTDWAVTPSGEVTALGRDGQLVFAMTAMRLGALVLAYAAAATTLAWISGALTTKRLLGGIALLAGLVLLRLAFEITVYCDLERVLMMKFPSHLQQFVDPWRQLPWVVLLGCGLSAMGWTPTAPPASQPVATPTGRPIAGVAWCTIACVGAGAAATATQLRLPSKPMSGKVVIDDLHSEYWARAGRRMQRDWYGDFSTYNLAAMTEYLGHHYPVTVNRTERYTPGSLDDASVLILKTPTLDFTPTETETILKFVEHGGGLILIGDHTNLLGTSSRLNQLSMPAGIAFVFDAVSNGGYGGFSVAGVPRVPHPVRGPDSQVAEFMTGCSLRLGLGVDALMVAPEELRIRGDYSTSSFFGRMYNDPRSELGPVAHAAAAPYGKGTVLAYSDSTCLSSFALFLYGRERLMTRAVDFVARAPYQNGLTRGVAGLLGILGLLVALTSMLRHHTPPWHLAATVAAGAGIGLGLLVVTAIHASTWPDPEPATPIPTLQYLSRNTYSTIPPVLGSNNLKNYDQVYDTLYAAIPRVGRFPKLVENFAEWDPASPLMFMLPASPLDAGSQRRFRERLEAGGSALVGVASTGIDFKTMESILSCGSLGIAYTDKANQVIEFTTGSGDQQRSLADGRIQVYETRVGAGRLILVLGIENWSREVLGHAFAIPDQKMRTLYESLYSVLDQLASEPSERRTYGLR